LTGVGTSGSTVGADALMIHPLIIMRHPVSVDFLKVYAHSESKGDSVSSYFSISEVVNARPDIVNAISVSLFCKDVDAIDADSLTPSNVEGSPWYEKYMKSLVRNIPNIFADPSFSSCWKLRIYIANDLYQQGTFFKKLHHPSVELFVMTTSSIGAQPGMMWRFLACGDKDLELAYVMDIDEDMSSKSTYLSTFLKHPDKILMKHTGGSGRISDPNPNDAFNPTFIIGSFSIWRPKLLDLDVKQMMEAFIRYRMAQSSTDNPWAYASSEQRNAWNSAVHRHTNGWGNHWFMYGFDERFLAHVLFYYVASKGGIVSPQSTANVFPEMCDYLLKSPGNIFLNY
jgi:hypothetical protein